MSNVLIINVNALSVYPFFLLLLLLFSFVTLQGFPQVLWTWVFQMGEGFIFKCVCVWEGGCSMGALVLMGGGRLKKIVGWGRGSSPHAPPPLWETLSSLDLCSLWKWFKGKSKFKLMKQYLVFRD